MYFQNLPIPHRCTAIPLPAVYWIPTAVLPILDVRVHRIVDTIDSVLVETAVLLFTLTSDSCFCFNPCTTYELLLDAAYRLPLRLLR